jgi:hypothetical protein
VLRDLHGCDDGFIALLPVIASGTQLLVLPLLGRVVDRTGSRPLLFFSLLVWVFHASLWGVLAAGVLPLTWPVLVAIQATAGIGGSAIGLASQRPDQHAAEGVQVQPHHDVGVAGGELEQVLRLIPDVQAAFLHGLDVGVRVTHRCGPFG